MRSKSGSLILLFCFITLTCECQVSKGNRDTPLKVEILGREKEKRMDILVDGKLFTSYCWPENVYKPVLYPVNSSAGTPVTRGFPLKPRQGERNDHIHQVGIWLNYGNVNGHDFWGNGSRGMKEPNGGEIKHLSVEKSAGGTGEGILITRESWIGPETKELLAERTEYHFIARGSLRIIDRITTLTAGDTAVFFKDTKEGMFGIRVARQLELPINESVILLDAEGNPSKQKISAKEGATGNYRSSEGVSGEAVWGTRAGWMTLDGSIGNELISLVICDHPKNKGFPTYWHARGYGLFAANPLGWSDFTQGKEVFGLILNSDESTTFRYRVIINSGTQLSVPEINELAKEFSGKY